MIGHQRGFTCCTERHLVDSGLALAIYGKLHQLCYGNEGGGVYFTTLEPLADFFAKPYGSIWRAVQALRKLGFLERVDTKLSNGWQERTFRFHTKSYRIVKHTEWAEKHPGKCYQALTMPWESHGDPLARKLYVISEGNVVWYENMLKGLRRTGRTDDEIESDWRSFIKAQEITPLSNLGWRGVRGKFLKHMKELVAAR